MEGGSSLERRHALGAHARVKAFVGLNQQPLRTVELVLLPPAGPVPATRAEGAVMSWDCTTMGGVVGTELSRYWLVGDRSGPL